MIKRNGIILGSLKDIDAVFVIRPVKLDRLMLRRRGKSKNHKR
jgi:hypothetical protein